LFVRRRADAGDTRTTTTPAAAFGAADWIDAGSDFLHQRCPVFQH